MGIRIFIQNLAKSYQKLRYCLSYPDSFNEALPILALELVILGRVIIYEVQKRPPTGTYIAILACLAALMSLRQAKKGWSTAIWMITLGLLAFFEIHTLYKAQGEYEQLVKTNAATFQRIANTLNTVSTRLDKVANKFDGVADKLDRMMRESRDARNEERKQFVNLFKREEELFNRQQSLVKESIQIMTGGDSFGYIRFTGLYNVNAEVVGYMPVFIKVGKYPLRNVSIVISNAEFIPGKKEIISQSKRYFVGDVYNQADISDLPIPKPNPDGKQLYSFFIDASNGNWQELLVVVNNKGHYFEDIHVRDILKGNRVFESEAIPKDNILH
jgi:hypothetical protein